ncbi:MAG: hypothetical protein V4693_05590 [Pseudomonadota bacterium]
MATDDDSPRELIERELARDPDSIVNTSIELLELLANALIESIGEQGFEILLFRSIQSVNLDFTWLMFDPRSRPADPEFNALRRCLEGEDLAEAAAASVLLFNTLIDSLELLIGKHLTMTTLQAALGRAETQKN